MLQNVILFILFVLDCCSCFFLSNRSFIMDWDLDVEQLLELLSWDVWACLLWLLFLKLVSFSKGRVKVWKKLLQELNLFIPWSVKLIVTITYHLSWCLLCLQYHFTNDCLNGSLGRLFHTCFCLVEFCLLHGHLLGYRMEDFAIFWIFVNVRCIY